jgi:HD-like signal output (HDOD) protein
MLFVDDEPDVLEGLRRSLRRQRGEWEMYFAESGAIALDLMAKSPFDVIVSDVRMPVLDGVTLLTQVRELYPSTIRIILSGHAKEDSVLRAVGPAHQYLAKPCDAEDLCATVRAAVSLRDVLADDDLKRLVARLVSVPSLPTLYRDIQTELRSEDPSIRNVAAIVTKDVGMSAKVLQLVNSAFFGLANEITDTSRAVMHLGMDTVRALSLATGVFSQLGSGDVDSSEMESLWSHSTRVAALAKRIAELERVGKDIRDASFQAGFLHDIVRLVLATNLPEQYSQALRDGDQGVPELERERAALGATHAEVGGYLLGIWGLPDTVVQAVAFHHEPSRFPTRGFSPLTAVHVAEVIDRCLAPDTPMVGEGLNGLDRDYLLATGTADRLEEWTRVCRKMLEEGVTS